MPLARGTAAVGYTMLLALFWAAGMPVVAAIPKDYQVDWEAILSRSPEAFIARLSAWLVPDCVREALGGPAAAAGAAQAAASPPRASSGGGGGESGGSEAGSGSGAGGADGSKISSPKDLPPPGELPRAAEVLSTMRRRIEALNGPNAPRLAL